MMPAASMPPGVTLRAARPDDALALAAFARDIFEATFGHSVHADEMSSFLDATYGADQQRAEIEAATMRTRLAEDDEGIAGFYQLKLPAPDALAEANRATIEVARFYAAARWHGRGLAKALMRAALDEARELGATRAWLGVWQENARAIAFYEKSGFRPTGTQSFFLGSVEQTDCVMTANLAEA